MPLIRSVGWETIDDLIYQQIRTIAFRPVNNLASKYLIDLFTRNSRSSSHNLRNTNSGAQIPKKKYQMDRNASRMGVLRLGIICRCKQTRLFPKVVLSPMQHLISLLFKFYVSSLFIF